MSPDVDRISIELAWPLRTQFGMIRLRIDRDLPRGIDHSVYQSNVEALADEVAFQVEAQGDRIERRLRPELFPDELWIHACKVQGNVVVRVRRGERCPKCELSFAFPAVPS